MNVARWLVALVVVGAGCTSTPDTTVSTMIATTIPDTTTTSTMVSPSEAINLGGDPVDVDYCLVHSGRTARFGSDMGYVDIPTARIEFEEWAGENPDSFKKMCAAAFLHARTSEVSDRVARLYGHDLVAAIESELSDVENVWCADHWKSVLSAADTLNVGPADMLPSLLGVRRVDVDDHQDADLATIWAYLVPDAYLRSCRAAFGAR